MTKKAQIINNSIDEVPEIYLRGPIDEYEDGSIAEAIDACRWKKAKKIRMLINSIGGSVALGQEVIGAMQLFKDEDGIIETINRGVANSTAGWIFSAGSKGHRKMMPFSTLFMHPPMYEDGTGLNDYQQGSEKHTLLMEAMEKIVSIFAPITGRTKNFIRNAMMSGTKYSAEKAVKEGFADEIVSISNSVSLKNDLKLEEIINATESVDYQIITKKTENKMKEVAILLNLNPEASESAVKQAVTALINRAEAAEADSKAKGVEVTQKDAEITALRNEISEVKDKEIVNYVKSYIGGDKVKQEQEAKLMNMAKADFDTFKSICPVSDNGSAIIDKDIKPDGQGGSDNSLEDAKKFFNMSNAAKSELKNTSPSEYRKLVNAYDKHLDKII